MSLANWFDGPSLLDSDGIYRAVEQRQLRAGDAIDCYRNLNRPHSFSVKSRDGIHNGLVTGYGRSVVIAKPWLVVGEKARQRVIKERRKNVHSYVRGTLVDLFDGDLISARMAGCIRVSYSPYVSGNFYQLERDTLCRPIASSIKPVEASFLERVSLAIVNGADVYLL